MASNTAPKGRTPPGATTPIPWRISHRRKRLQSTVDLGDDVVGDVGRSITRTIGECKHLTSYDVSGEPLIIKRFATLKGGGVRASALGFIGERGGIFPQHEWQNGKEGTPNEIDEANNFHDTEMEVSNKSQTHFGSTRAGGFDLENEARTQYGEQPTIARFNNLAEPEVG